MMFKVRVKSLKSSRSYYEYPYNKPDPEVIYIGSLFRNTGLNSFENHKAILPVFNVGQSSARQRNADDRPF